MATNPPVSRQTYQYYVQEASELMQAIEADLQSLRSRFSIRRVHRLMRSAHTLKGASASVGLETIQKATHSLEDIFKALCYKDTVITTEIESLIFQGYDCLQVLMSAQLAGTRVDGDDMLNRMAEVVSQLQTILGDRFDQQGYLPTSTDLGFDMTQSIFQLGVEQRLADLEQTLVTQEPSEVRSQLLTQADVFKGLGESLELPGFEAIARMTHDALQQTPDSVLEIAPVAIADFRAAQQAVLAGDRTQGGTPSVALQQLSGYLDVPPRDDPNIEPARTPISENQTPPDSEEAFATQPSPPAPKTGWLKRYWHQLRRPGSPITSPSKTASAALSQPVDEISLLSDETVSQTDQSDESTAVQEIDSSLLSIDIESSAEPVTEEAKPATDSPQQLSDQTSPSKPDATIRMSVEHLETLNRTMGELLTQQNRQTLYNEQLMELVQRLLTRIETQQQQLNQQQGQQLTRRLTASAQAIGTPYDYAHFDTLELDRYSDIQLLLQSCLEETVQLSESAEAIEIFVKRSEQTLQRQKRLLTNTRETLLEARMVPLGTVFQQFPDTIERLKLQYQKPVDIFLEGEDVLVDRTVADGLYEPLVHLVRNAFDHGIEAPDKRLAQGKPFTGTITLRGVQQGHHLLISVGDDGGGLDLQHIKMQAIARELITPEQADTLTPEQTVELLFEPGFSTAATADALSGRGVGLDVVRERMRSRQGWVSVNHQPGSGTSFTLHIPTSLSIAKLMLCQSQGRIYGLMLDAVEHILIPTKEQIRTWEGGKMLTWQTQGEEHLVPVNALDQVLHYASPVSGHPSAPSIATDRQTSHSSQAKPVVLLKDHNRIVGIEIDQLHGEQELVISPLGNTIVPPAYLYGSSMLADGQLTLVLDGLKLAQIVTSQRKTRPEIDANSLLSSTVPAYQPVFHKQQVLTIDDSITVRATISEALEKANYQVIQARDGAEALSLLERYPNVQVILCDIEMPGMNGFEFLKVRQQQSVIAAIPTIMLTSRMGDKHRQLTEELGANGYLTKPYLIPKLLQAVKEAIEDADNSTSLVPSLSIAGGRHG